MNLLTVIVVIVIVGLALWAINKYIPMQPTIKNILNIVVVIFLILWLLNGLGLFSHLSKINI